MRARTRFPGDRLAVLAGARLDLLAVAPGARAKFVALGGVLLSTGALAVLSASFAVHMALGASWPVALLFGIGWGIVIVNLDRMLLVGMAHDSSWQRNAAMAVPRIALAAVLGTVISTPLTLQVFDKEIEATMVTMQAEAADAFTTELAADARFAVIPALQRRVADEQAVIATGGATDPNADPRVGTAQTERDAKKAAYEAAQARSAELDAKAQCELDGSCGTGEAGTGQAYLEARAAADAHAGVVDTAKDELDAAAAAITAGASRSMQQATADLETDRAELARLTEQQTALQVAFDETNADNTGILIRLQALSALSESNTTMAIAHYMLALLFISVELLPVLMKMLLNFGPRSTYDRLSDIRDDGDLEVEQLQQSARVEVEQAVQDLLVLAEKERVDKQKEQVLARRRARLAAAVAARESGEIPAPRTDSSPEDAGRRMWDTGPIIGLAREAASRTVRTMRRRPDAREVETV